MSPLLKGVAAAELLLVSLTFEAPSEGAQIFSMILPKQQRVAWPANLISFCCVFAGFRLTVLCFRDRLMQRRIFGGGLRSLSL